MNCPVCDSQLAFKFQAVVLQKWKASYDYCDCCGFLRARDPSWLPEAHDEAISSADTGLVRRNVAIARRLTSLLYFVLRGRRDHRYLDAAGGYGLLTRLMRDYGFEYFWQDRYCPNLLARGFEYHPGAGPCDAVTAIEALEHQENPVAFIEESLALGQAETLIFTTELFRGDPPRPEDWWYYALETGQHISFFQGRTLERMAARLGMLLASEGGLHLLTRRRPVSRRAMKLAVGPLSHLGARWARGRLGSRTVTDRDEIFKRLRSRQR